LNLCQSKVPNPEKVVSANAGVNAGTSSVAISLADPKVYLVCSHSCLSSRFRSSDHLRGGSPAITCCTAWRSFWTRHTNTRSLVRSQHACVSPRACTPMHTHRHVSIHACMHAHARTHVPPSRAFPPAQTHTKQRRLLYH
jgi:hypothetical protein